MSTFFIGLGFQKCATTWLSMRLKLHPDIWYPYINELHFWDSQEKARRRMPKQYRYVESAIERLKGANDEAQTADLIDQLCYWRRYSQMVPKNFGAYMRLFRQAEGYKACGEITPSYIGLSEETLRLIYAGNPNVKVMLLMREPIARIWSQIRHERKLRPKNVNTPATMLKYLESGRMSSQARYDTVIEKVRRVFPVENVGCFFFEDMISDQEAYLRSICTFLEIDFDPVMIQNQRRGKSEEASEAMPDKVKARALELYGDVAHNTKALLGDVPESWTRGQ